MQNNDKLAVSKMREIIFNVKVIVGQNCIIFISIKLIHTYRKFNFSYDAQKESHKIMTNSWFKDEGNDIQS